MKQPSCEVTQICDSLNVIFRAIDVYGQTLNSEMQSKLEAPVCSIGRIPSCYEFESPIFTKSDSCVIIPFLHDGIQPCIIFPLYEKKMFSENIFSYELIAFQYNPDESIDEQSFSNIPDLYSECITKWVNNIKSSSKYLRKF